MTGSRRWALAVAVLLLAGCSLQVPADPEGTFDRVEGDTLRVGVTHNPPWTEVVDGGDPGGADAALVSEFASRLDAEVDWTVGNEESLVADLEHGALDIVIGGFTDRTPWTEQVAMTVPYAEATGPRGETEKHVMLARMGENRFLLELERFLLDEGGAP